MVLVLSLFYNHWHFSFIGWCKSCGQEINTSSFECSNSKSSGALALARPTVTGRTITMTFLYNFVGMCYMYMYYKASKHGIAKKIAHGATKL
jgi:hypothetical protein